MIGRGDDAAWVILDNDLSKAHAEVRRGWDGTRIIDLESKNGTRVDGVLVRDALLGDGSVIALGKVRIRFRDLAEVHMRGGTRTPAVASPVGIPPATSPASPPSSLVSYAALAIMVLALAGLVWVLSSWSS